MNYNNAIHRNTYKQFIQEPTLYVLSLVMLLLTGCNDPNDIPEVRTGDETEIGFVSVELDVSALNVRSGEALIGNIITDAMAEAAVEAGYDVDFAITNGGAIRFDPIEFPDAIFPAGSVTRADLLNFLPFDNRLVIITVSGEQLKQIFERSVSGLPGLPSPPGQFLQVSQRVSLFVDLLGQPQIVDLNQTPAVIVTEGNRVTNMLVGGQPVEPRLIYTLVTNEFIANGGDGYVTFSDINEGEKVVLTQLDRDALENYLIDQSPLSPVLENRINIVD